ncbi:MAG: hypothetical protein LBV26_08445 [Bacteroidales bacterium]|jgi:hypothetical protein|nr:hypothetical protein [Bacteroidales bacterium]
MQRLLFIILLAVWFIPAQAQDGGYAPAAGSKQVSLLLGAPMFYYNPNYVIDMNEYGVYDASSNTVTMSPAGMKISVPQDNYIINMLGVELKYFVKSNIAVGFAGAGFIYGTPGKSGIPGVSNTNTIPATPVLPTYNEIDAELESNAVGTLSGFYYFNTGNERIAPYGGASFTFQYAGLTAEDAMPANPQLDEPLMGPRKGQIFGWSPALVGGIEYSVQPGFLIGFEIKPVSYYSSSARLYPQQGMEAMEGKLREFSFFSQPRFKIGFRF